jgi:hypothetical protein
MPPVTDVQLRELRHRYNAAYTAYQSCVIALNEAAMSGVPLSHELLDKEAKALRELNEARAKLLAAMAEMDQRERAAD